MALDLKIHADLDSLDKDDQPSSRCSRQAAKGGRRTQTNAQAASALTALNRDIDSVAQMAMKASEGDLLHETKLRDHLAYLAADIDLSYDRPTAATGRRLPRTRSAGKGKQAKARSGHRPSRRSG